jgi:hypothetical protein
MSTSGAGDVQTFEVANADIAGQPILAVQVAHLTKKQSSGTSTVSGVIRSGGVDYANTPHGPSASYYFERSIWTKDPDDDGEISDTDFNAMEFGVKKVS